MRMIRITKMTKMYGKNIDLTRQSEIDDIETFVSEGTPVLLVDSLDELRDLNIDPEEVEMVN